MAEKFTPQVLRKLMALITDRLNVTTAGDLAVKLGRSATRPHGVRTMQNWMTGESGPQYASIMEMLAAASLLAPEALAIWRGVSLPEAERLIAEAAEERARRLADQQEREALARRKKESA